MTGDCAIERINMRKQSKWILRYKSVNGNDYLNTFGIEPSQLT